MKLRLFSFTAAFVASFALASCGSFGGVEGMVINEPTVDEMARLEKQWGMAPRQAKSKVYSSDGGDTSTIQSQPMQVQPKAAAVPQLAPAPAPASASAPPLPDASTVQKLRN